LAVAPVANRQTVTISWIGEKGVSEFSIAIIDDRVELAALLYDQVGLQKVIDRLIAVKGLQPEKPVAEPTESSLVIKRKRPPTEAALLGWAFVFLC
jgi:hypothetical protein